MEQLYPMEPPQQDPAEYPKTKFSNKPDHFAKAVSNHIVKKALKSTPNVKVETYFEPADSVDSVDGLKYGRSEIDYNKSLLNEVEQRYGNLRFDGSQISYNY